MLNIAFKLSHFLSCIHPFFKLFENNTHYDVTYNVRANNSHEGRVLTWCPPPADPGPR